MRELGRLNLMGVQGTSLSILDKKDFFYKLFCESYGQILIKNQSNALYVLKNLINERWRSGGLLLTHGVFRTKST